MTPLRLVLIFLAGAIGGAVNSIAGGGTLVTFPALVGAGIPPIVANATNTMALWPGALSSMWGYRGVLAGTRRWAAALTVPSLAGGIAGALLLLRTSSRDFDHIVPWLVFGATTLFLLQRTLVARFRRASTSASDPESELPPSPGAAVIGYQFLVGIYGGYFGAGIGILMLAALGFMGFTHIHRMNGLKNWFALCINAVAAIVFAVGPSLFGLGCGRSPNCAVVNWPVAVVTGVGAIAGGYVGARMAQRVPQQRVRQAVVVIGFASGLWLLLTR
jgi:uncharacterized membrane protein YfcA